MGTDIRVPDPYCKLARVWYPLIRRTRRVSTRKCTAITRQSPSATSLEPTDPPGGNSIARQRAPVGDS